MFAEAECVVFRAVHQKTWKIVASVIHLALYSTSLDAKAIAEHVTEAIGTNNIDGKIGVCVCLTVHQLTKAH